MCFYLIEVAWFLWHCRICLCLQDQAGWGCLCVKLPAVPLMAQLALSTYRLVIPAHGWGLRIDIFTELFSIFITFLPQIAPCPLAWDAGANAAVAEQQAGRAALCPHCCQWNRLCSPHMETQTWGIVCHRESSEEILLYFWMQFVSSLYVWNLYVQHLYF